MLGYADDLCVLCSTPMELRRVIKKIKEWSLENNLLLNEKKSGIMEITPRMGVQKCFLKQGELFEGIPVVSDYKYLGLIVDQKLCLDKQLTHIKEKADFLVIKLWPVLKTISLDDRINLWTILVRPLFEMMIFPYNKERSPTNKEKVHALIRRTFKKFCLLAKSIDDVVVNRLMDFDFEERVNYVVKKAESKWFMRKSKQAPDVSSLKVTKKDKCRAYYPNGLQVLMNLKAALCPYCNIRCSSNHLRDHHGIEVPQNSELLDLTENESKLRRSKNMGRKLILKEVSEL